VKEEAQQAGDATQAAADAARANGRRQQPEEVNPSGKQGSDGRPGGARRFWNRKRMIIAFLVGAVLAVVVTVLAMNFTTGEKEIQRSLEHRYAVDDPQFLRELGILLGPAIVGGNRIENLENGGEIFPAMLAACAARSRPSISKPTSTGRAPSARSSPRRSRSARAPA
jgi:hypothetical protein